MKLKEFKYDFYGAIIHKAELGPRREVTLTMELWPTTHNGQRKHSWSRGEGQFITIRFSGINNYSEIEAAFSEWDEQIDRWNGLHYLAYAKDKNSKPGNLHLIMEYDNTETRIRINCQNITIKEIEGNSSS